METEFRITKTGDDDYEWRLRTASDQTAAKGEGYPTRDEAMEGAEAVRAAVGDAPVTDATGELAQSQAPAIADG